MNTMQSFETVLQALPSGGEVRYNTYRHSSVREGWNGGRPYSPDEAFRPFLNLVVVLEAPDAYDEEGYRVYDEDNERIVGVLSDFDPNFYEAVTTEPEGTHRTWRYLCQAAK